VFPQNRSWQDDCAPRVRKGQVNPGLFTAYTGLYETRMLIIRRSGERGFADHGWLKTYHTFSFADYHDPAWMAFGPLRVINDDVIGPGMGFGTHPHRDMEIITYVLSGSLEHKDSMGNGRVIRAGEVQYMAAGTGVFHSEFNPSRTTPCHLLQIWIQPDRRGTEPRYAERSMAEALSGQWQLVASKQGRDGSIPIHQETDLWLARLNAGQRVQHTVLAGRRAWLHVAEGAVSLGDHRLEGGDAVGTEGPLTLDCVAESGAQLLLFDLP
jgi:redox-sensitive bicupin YhaK (pirin superfamily)